MNTNLTLLNAKTIVDLDEALTKAGTNANAVHQIIGDILATRSISLHAATSDLLISKRQEFANYAKRLNALLVKAFCQLPDHRPGLPYSVSFNGKFLLLQSVDDNDAVYVTVDKFDESKFYNHRVSLIERLCAELEATSKTVEAILALEAVEADPVDADDGDETAAVITRTILG